MNTQTLIINSTTFNKDGVIFYVETPTIMFRANDLTEVLMMWHARNCFEGWPENLKAIIVGRLE